MDFTNPDFLNKALRPWVIAALAMLAFAFLAALGAIMLFRYAAFGEISWEGLAAFITGVLGPVVRHFENRNGLYKLGRLVAPGGQAPDVPGGGLVNGQAIGASA